MMLDKFEAIHMYVYLVVALVLVSALSRLLIWLRGRRWDRQRWLMAGILVALLMCAVLVRLHGDVHAANSGSNPCLLPTPHIPHDPTPAPVCLPWSTATQGG